MGLFFREPGGESPKQKVLLVSLAILFSFLLSGIIFGYSALVKPLVHDSRAFADLCQHGHVPCSAQTDSLTLMYTIGAATISGCAILVGLYLDYMGPRITVCTGALISWSGFLCLAFAPHQRPSLSHYLYYIGFFNLSLGGPCIFNSLVNFGELFPRQSGAVISALNGAFNASTAVVFALAEVVEIFHVHLSTVLLAYSVVPVVVFFVSFFLFADRPHEQPHRIGAPGGTRSRGEIHRVWLLSQKKLHRTLSDTIDELPNTPMPSPQGPGPQAPPTYPTETTPLLSNMAVPGTGQRRQQEPASPPEIYNTAFGKQLQSFVFWSLALVTGFLVLRVNFYIATVSDQILFTARLTHNEEEALTIAGWYTSLFNTILPLGGIVMVPIVGYSLIFWGLGPSFALIAVFNFVFSLINLLNWFPVQLQIVAFVAFATSRPFMFSAMAAYIGRLFGFRNFGKLYGVARVVGSAATCLQYPLSALAKTTLKGDYFYVNLGFLAISMLLFLYPIYLVNNVFYGFMFRPLEETSVRPPVKSPRPIGTVKE